MFLLALLLELVNVGEGTGVSELFAVDCEKDSHSGSAEMNRCLGDEEEEGDLSKACRLSLLLYSSVAVRTKQEKCGEEGVFVILLT